MVGVLAAGRGVVKAPGAPAGEVMRQCNKTGIRGATAGAERFPDKNFVRP